MVSSVSAVADGTPGIVQIVAQLARLKDYYGRLPAIRAAAVAIIGNTGDHDQGAQITALAQFVRQGMRFLSDPLGAEFIQTPDVLLSEINANGFAYGDCDDHCLLFASLAEAIGIPSTIVGVAASGSGPPDHVIVVCELDSGQLVFDLVAKTAQQPIHDLSNAIFPPS